MPIRVTCRGCHTRFTVSDRFAGKEGPCPKCKKIIKIPLPTEEVVIHAPDDAGAKDVSGRALSKPIFRKEPDITPLTWTIVLGTILTFLVLTVVMRFQFTDKINFPLWLIIAGAVAVSVPAVYGAYGILRDSELAPFRGRELWVRIGCCAAVYALLWGAMPLAQYATRSYDTLSWTIALLSMIGLGAFAGSLSFDFEYLIGLLHYGMYLGATLLMRWLAGIGFLPGQIEVPTQPATSETTSAMLGHVLWWASVGFA